MTKVEVLQQKKKSDRPVEFTHRMMSCGWDTVDGLEIAHLLKMRGIKGYKVVYLGRCKEDGDMFALVAKEIGVDFTINIYKGHLNSGEY